MIHAGHHQPRLAAIRLTTSSHQLATTAGRNAARAWQRSSGAVTHTQIAPMKVSYDARVASPHLRRVQQPRERSRAAHACARAQGAEAASSGLGRCGYDALVLGPHAAHAGRVQERSDVP